MAEKNSDGTYSDVSNIDAKVGVGDTTYKAKWKEIPNRTTYKVVWWLEDPDYVPDSANPDVPDVKYNHWYDKTYVGTANSIKQGESFKDDNGVKALDEYPYAVYDAESTDKNVVVKGDGTTVVNVYYKRKEYTLKFYYARSSGTGSNIVYEVAGGSTHSFAHDKDEDSNDVGALLETVGDNQWGTVEQLPILNSNGNIKGYTLGKDTYNSKIFYYLSFNAKYDANISNIFPVEVFDPVLVADSENVYYGDYGYFSGWNAQKGTVYGTKDNPTVKGNYQYLDDELLWEDNRSSNTICFLAFWENACYLDPGNPWNIPHQWTYKLYIPVLDGEGDVPIESYKGKEYKLYDSYVVCDDADFDGQTKIQLRGYEYIDGFEVISERKLIDTVTVLGVEKNIYSRVAKFYYSRETHKLSFSNNGIVETPKLIEFGTLLKNENYEPDYPDTLEPNTHYFDGWYTSAVFVPETKVDWDTFTMPENDILLYACWKPINRTVTFSNHYADALAGDYLSEFGGDIPHGSYIPEAKIPDYTDVNASDLGTADYTPIGWFYFDEITGTKTRFNPASMPVTKELHLFMEWESNQVVPYRIEYIAVKEGVEVKIAPDMTGYSFAGLTRTFTAKTGSQLDQNYQKKYYPNVGSHSILMTEELTNEGETTNTYKFIYEYRESVNYTVNYYDESTKQKMTSISPNPKSGNNQETGETVITEKFVPVSGYMPDAFYKRLVLSSDDSKNVINFYYEEDASHSYYVVRHMIESVAPGKGGTIQYEEYSMIQGVGDIGKPVTEKIMSIGGYTYDKVVTMNKAGTSYSVGDDTVSGTVTNSGLEMFVYYSRNVSGYHKRYREWGADESAPDLHDVIIVEGKYGDPINIDLSKDWAGKNDLGEDQYHDHTTFESNGIKYELISENTYNSTMSIVELNDDGTIKKYPEIVFYYKAKKVSVSYEAVCKTVSTGFGYVSIASENVATAANLTGCVPMPVAGYEFVGWYKDKACTMNVDKSWVGTDNRLKLTTLPAEDTTYYALFKPTAGTLIIENRGDTVKATDTFVYHVQGIDGVAATIDLYVSITGIGSVKVLEVPVGDYNITQLAAWSWRYDADSNAKECEISAGETETISFQNVYQYSKWLGSEAKKDKIFS